MGLQVWWMYLMWLKKIEKETEKYNSTEFIMKVCGVGRRRGCVLGVYTIICI